MIKINGNKNENGIRIKINIKIGININIKMIEKEGKIQRFENRSEENRRVSKI